MLLSNYPDVKSCERFGWDVALVRLARMGILAKSHLCRTIDNWQAHGTRHRSEQYLTKCKALVTDARYLGFLEVFRKKIRNPRSFPTFFPAPPDLPFPMNYSQSSQTTI
jgi:hypothetical protein